VGKTTVTLGLASAAFAKGVSTLVVDLDPQSDVSTGMDIAVAGHLNVADVLASPKEKIVRSAIAPSGWTKGRPGTVDVLIGSPSAINFDGPHPSIRDIWKLEEALAHVEKDYELVLIDCAPSLNALTRTAWAASDRVAVVTEPGLFSVAAADRALRAIEEIRRGLSPRLQPLGIIVNRARVQSLEHQFRIKELRDMFGPLVLSPQLPERTSLQQAQGAAKPLHIWPGESAQEMARNFDQLLDRVLRTARLAEDPEAATTGPVYEMPNLFAAPEQAQPVFTDPAQGQPAQDPFSFPPPQQQPPVAQPPVQQPPVQQPPAQQPPAAYPPAQQPPAAQPPAAQPPYGQPPVGYPPAQQPPAAYPPAQPPQQQPTQQPGIGIPGFDFPAPQPTQ
jgi:cellulose biosynthesis protein BcsQ